MTEARDPLTAPTKRDDAALADPADARILGTYGDDESGPLVLCTGGIHGNEPSGIVALRRVISRLEAQRPDFRGRLIAVAGNLPALSANRRFIDRDLNRGWSVRRVSEVLERPDTTEDMEQAALLSILVPAIRGSTREVYLLDLHTTSSTSPPFVTLSDTLEIRRFAGRLGLPLVLGIEEEIDTMVDYLSGFGALAIGVEAGRHDDPVSIDVHEAALWISLSATGCLAAGAGIVDLAACRRRLAEARRGLPGVFEVMYRRAIDPGDAFRMSPGFANFAPVRAGEIVAHDARGPVAVPLSGRLFLPLYQAQGDDGYFLAKPVRPVWLAISRALRRVGAAKLLPLLPGVRRSVHREDTLIVSRRIARWLVNEIFHLLGYRRVREAKRHIVFRDRAPLLRD
jgi:succinylglutamate desuccinylase